MKRLWAIAAALIMIVALGIAFWPDEHARVVAVRHTESVQAEWIEGDPVWVVEDGRDVRVVEALNPHPAWGLPEIVGWCASTRGFEAWWDGSTFDDAGRWLFGPAPRDLGSYPLTERHDKLVQVGELRLPNGRSKQQSDFDGPSCAWNDGNPPAGAVALHHDEQGSERDLFVGTITTAAGHEARFCPTPGSATRSCPESVALRIPQFLSDGQAPPMTYGVRLLARERDGVLSDVLLLPPS